MYIPININDIIDEIFTNSETPVSVLVRHLNSDNEFEFISITFDEQELTFVIEIDDA